MRWLLFFALLGYTLTGSLSRLVAQTTAVNVKINFQPDTAPVPGGYLKDIGAAYSATRGSGWVRQDSLGSTHVPLDVTPNTRDRNRSGIDQRLDTMLHMQFPPEVFNPNIVYIPAAWEYALPDGIYRVTVSVGDQPDAVNGYDSRHSINVEGVPAINRFTGTAAQEYRQTTVQVAVNDGKLTLDARGGYNTKINYVEIVTVVPAANRPSVTRCTPPDGASNVNRDVFVAAEVRLPNVGQGIDTGTLTASTVRLVRTSDLSPVAAHLNTSGGGDVIVLQPAAILDANTSYTFQVTNALKDVSGAAFVPFTSSFTTGTAGGGTSGPIAFEQVPLGTATGRTFTSVVIGPDGKLYAGTLDGAILRFPLKADGTTGTPQVITSLQNANGGARALIGMAFDPAATASNLVLWVSHSAASTTDAPDWAGKITRLSGVNLGAVKDYVIHLPRSIRDHMTNSVAFGPDGALYVCQGSNTAMGAPDNAWGLRPERLLNAAVLRVNLAAITAPPRNVQTEAGGTYDPDAPGAPVTIYASGVRNAYDLVWHSNGQLYVPTNGSAAGGNTPGTAATFPSDCSLQVVPALTNVPVAQDDFLFRIVAGGYYGHPNPLRCEYVLNGGNPTSGIDPAEVAQYPSGIKPEPSWKGFAFDFGAHYSPDGAIEYKNNAFGGALRGKLLVARYSGGDDIIALTPGANLNIASAQTGIPGFTGFVDPLDLIENPANGFLYVTELGAARITLLRPLTGAPGSPDIAATPIRLIYNDVQGGTASAAQAVTIRNLGTAALTLSSIALAGTNANQFQISSAPAVPATVAAGASATVRVVFNPTTAGPRGAVLRVQSNDSATPVVDVALRGLGTLGLGGTNEPSLQWILDTYEIPVHVGDPDPTNNAMPTSALLGEEVSLQRFQRSGEGAVTIEPLAVFGPTANDPAVRFGWYASGNVSSQRELFTVASTSAQSLNPPPVGTTSFDPGAGAFGFYSVWPFFANRAVYSEDALNAFDTVRHHVRVYPLKDKSGGLVPNAYIVAMEETTSAQDYQDIVVIVRNVQPLAVGGPGEIELENLDGVPFNDRLVFSRIGSLTSPPSNGVHDRATLRIKNLGAGPLRITGLPIVGAWALASPITLPTSIAAGGHLDVTLQFRATAGDVNKGTLTIQSDDANEPSTVVQLAGFWQSLSENNQEPSLPELVQVYGYGTTIVGPGQLLNRAGHVETAGEEVLSPYWRRADTTRPISVRQLNAFHSQGVTATLFWFAKGTTTRTKIVTHAANDGQTVLPHLDGSTTAPAAGTFSPAGPFGFNIDFSEWSDPALNSQTADQDNGCTGACGHHVRFWPVRDRAGLVIPNTWLMAMDYSGINYDYNDNVHLITNIRPENAALRPRNTLARIDVGNAASYTGVDGRVWAPDTGLFTPSTAIAESRGTPAIANTLDDALYQTYRGNVGSSTPQASRIITFNIPVTTPQTVGLRLHFAELYWGAPGGGPAGPGRRVFDILAEGVTLRSNFDITAATGAALRAVVLPFENIQVNDGRLTLSLKASVDFPSIAAIEVLSPPPNPTFTGIAWSTVAPSPVPRSEALGAVVNGKLYTFGGYVDSTFAPTRRCDVYNPATNVWARLADMPKPFTHAGTAVDGRDVYCAGGYVGTSTGGQIFATREVWKYNVDANAWTTMPLLPQARGSGALVVLGRELHCFGGADINRADQGEHWVLALDGGTSWTTAAALPDPRSHMGYVALGGKIYAIGGQHGVDASLTTLATVYVWNPAAPGSWATVASLPRARSHISASTFVLGHRILVAGGEIAHESSIADVTAYDPSSNAWQALTPLPVPRFSGVAGSVGSLIYFTTGSMQTTTYRGVPGN